jgi:hypothetical protein
MSTLPHRIDMLGHHRNLVPTIARWHWDEWGDDYPDDTPEGWTDQLARKTRTDGLPCTWVAFVGGVPVGAVAVEIDGVEARPEFTPDLAGLFVCPSTATAASAARS